MTIEPSDAFANDLLEQLRQAASEAEMMALSEKYEVHFARLKTVNPARAHHIVNLVMMRRKEFERKRQRENEDQMDMFR